MGVQPQLYADNLECLSRDLGLLWRAARFATGYVRLVGQEPAPSKCVLLSTSREVRRDMKDWVFSDGGGLSSLVSVVWWSFGFYRTWLVFNFSCWGPRLVLIFLPLDFYGRVRVVRSMYLPAALHGIEASLLASGSLRKLRSSICRVVWLRRQPLASVLSCA